MSLATAVRRRLAAVRGSDDSGQLVLLVIAYTTVALALVLVVASASAVHLQRKRLLEAADGAALDAADAIAEEIYFPGGASPSGVPVTDASVRDAVADYLDARSAQQEFDDLVVDPTTGTPDGRTAVVTLRATVQPPLIGWAMEAFSDGVPLTATSRARVDTG